MATEPSPPERNKISKQPLTPEAQRGERLAWIIDQLSIAAIAKGQAFTTERLRINAEDLIDIPKEALAAAFSKARRELDYPPGVAELRRFALADDEGKINAEMRAAWDVLIKFVDKWARWNSFYSQAHIESGAPTLPQRITDSVRRSGGWAAYLGMEPDDFPFVQKRFFEEYKAWTAVNLALPDLAKLLESSPAGKTIQLLKPMERLPSKPNPVIPVKRCPPPPADVEIADRREMLRQQADALKKRRKEGA